jgi:ATP-dependent Clp protease ATP-binding subunit ClpA
MLERAARLASTGVITSIELLVAQLGAEGSPFRALLDGKVAHRALHEALISALETPEHATTGSSKELSATVEKTLAGARDLASTAGDPLITLEHIARAFAALGGGVAGEVLAQLGISLTPALQPDLDAAASGQRPSESANDDIFESDGELRLERFDTLARSVIDEARRTAKELGEVGVTTTSLAIAIASSTAMDQHLKAWGITGRELARKLAQVVSSSATSFVNQRGQPPEGMLNRSMLSVRCASIIPTWSMPFSPTLAAPVS